MMYLNTFIARLEKERAKYFRKYGTKPKLESIEMDDRHEYVEFNLFSGKRKNQFGMTVYQNSQIVRIKL